MSSSSAYREFRPHPLLQELVDCYWVDRFGALPVDQQAETAPDALDTLNASHTSPIAPEIPYVSNSSVTPGCSRLADLSMEIWFLSDSPLQCQLGSELYSLTTGMYLIGMRQQALQVSPASTTPSPPFSSSDKEMVGAAAYGGHLDTGRKAVGLSISDDSTVFAIRFRPGGFTRLFDKPADFYTQQIVPADSLWGQENSQLLKQLTAASDNTERAALLDQLLLILFDKGSRSSYYRHHQLLQSAIRTIYSSKGTLPVHELSQLHDTGYKAFQRLFKLHIGIPPKLFCRIVRFHFMFLSYLEEHLDSLPSLGKSNTPGGAAMDEVESLHKADAYYDQSHTIKEFHQFAGVTSLWDKF